VRGPDGTPAPAGSPAVELRDVGRLQVLKPTA
jgi:hypothetical protein